MDAVAGDPPPFDAEQDATDRFPASSPEYPRAPGNENDPPLDGQPDEEGALDESPLKTRTNEPPLSRSPVVAWFTTHLTASTWAEPASFYTPMFLCEFVSFLTICIGWSGFKHEDNAKSAAALLQSNQIPSGLLVYMLGQFLIIVADRAIHLNRALRSKLVLYYALLGFVHLLVFYLIPLETGRSAGDNPVLIILYLLKVCYFFISAAQIRAMYVSLLPSRPMLSRRFASGRRVYCLADR